jgi:hypothetical protein
MISQWKLKTNRWILSSCSRVNKAWTRKSKLWQIWSPSRRKLSPKCKKLLALEKLCRSQFQDFRPQITDSGAVKCSVDTTQANTQCTRMNTSLPVQLSEVLFLVINTQMLRISVCQWVEWRHKANFSTHTLHIRAIVIFSLRHTEVEACSPRSEIHYSAATIRKRLNGTRLKMAISMIPDMG